MQFRIELEVSKILFAFHSLDVVFNLVGLPGRGAFKPKEKFPVLTFSSKFCCAIFALKVLLKSCLWLKYCRANIKPIAAWAMKNIYESHEIKILRRKIESKRSGAIQNKKRPLLN